VGCDSRSARGAIDAFGGGMLVTDFGSAADCVAIAAARPLAAILMNNLGIDEAVGTLMKRTMLGSACSNCTSSVACGAADASIASHQSRLSGDAAGPEAAPRERRTAGTA
jgi:hypothetical protein